MSDVVDPGLAAAGARKIDWASLHAPVLARLRAELHADGSLRGRRVGVILPLEPKTALLAQILAEAGAEVAVSAPVGMVQDDVAAGLASRGVEVFARSDTRDEDLPSVYARVLATRPELLVDDRADLIRMAHTSHAEALDHLVGATEQTTSGIIALRAMEATGALRVPCIAGNDARCKHLFDNRYGSGQSVLTSIMDATNLLLAGTTVVVVGYGWVGKGVARVARGLGARVVVTEIDPVAALEAHHDGHDVAPVRDACAIADFVIGTSGCRDAVPFDAVAASPDGAILANAAGISDELPMAELTARADTLREVRPHVVEYTFGDRSVFVIGDGRCVNLSAGEGHPIEIMDLTFAVQGFATRHLARHGQDLPAGLHPLPPAIDDAIARAKLTDLGVAIDSLTPEQEQFLASWDLDRPRD